MTERVSRPIRPLFRLQSLRHLNGRLRALVETRLWLKVLIGMVCGLLAGLAIGPSAGLLEPATGAVVGEWLALPGQLFLAAIQMIVVPLVVASIIRGLAASEDTTQLRQMGLGVTAFFVVTTAGAAALGLVLAQALRPGVGLATLLAGAEDAGGIEDATLPEPALSLADLPDRLVSLFPLNPLEAMASGEMLQVVVFSIVVGVALVSMAPTRSRPMLDLLGSLQDVCMTVVRWAMVLAPYAVFGLMARFTSQVGLEALGGMAFYVLTVLLGLLLLLGAYLLLLAVFARQDPWAFLKATRELMLLAFSTSSSAAVMPLSIKTAEERLGVRSSVSQFVIPLGATINMNGTALYQGVATAFLAQVYGIDLGVAGMVLVVATAVGASIGSPATPGVGIVILAMVLTSVGVPAQGVTLILGVDRILDMSRTAVNVTGDIVACKLTDLWLRRRETGRAPFPAQGGG